MFLCEKDLKSPSNARNPIHKNVLRFKQSRQMADSQLNDP